MATIHDYASLQQAITDFEKRSDLTSYTDYFIQSAEDDIYTDIYLMNQGRGIRALEKALTGDTSLGYLAVPSDYTALRYMTCTVGSQTYTLQRRTGEFIYQAYPNRTSDSPPTFVARENANFIFGPYPDGTYTLGGIYWSRPAALSSTNTTTWMTSDIPSALFAACMVAVKRFLKNPEGVAFWQAEYQGKLQKYIETDKGEALSGSELAMQAL